MEIQVMTTSPAVSTNATPYTTAPSTPHRFPHLFYTAPTSPIHSLVSFPQHDDDNDFAFNFTGNPEPNSISAADDLFHAGKIKPLTSVSDEPPISPMCKKKNFDSFTETYNQTPGDHPETTQNPPKRGRKTTTKPLRIKHKVSRSSSPVRISDILSDEDPNRKNSLTWYSKWNLKNLILFRSASEGSARRIKDPVIKYSRITKSDEDVKISSFRSVDSCRSEVGTSRPAMRTVSAHEMHYTANRAVAEEMRRKTYLPYKAGLFGCLGFRNNGAGGVHHQISRGITSVMKQR
ncbi:hypothetical protein E3N88_18278 [Mikania micrantha]|uniref:Uncharacterized protein n=1 Tax=Mikania micrantha TaxID=192012 RepID=A0A5N6NU70_9ASTR|nr:hypothetical protein E3N88_18278 [Mikania micrantha]